MDLLIGEMEHGVHNNLCDVAGVTVGHSTIDEGSSHTGVTVVMPCPENPFLHPLTAGCSVFNGFGKTTGLIQVEELGTLETPIALTNTLNVGKVHDAMVGYMLEQCKKDNIKLRSVNPVVCECNDSGLNDIALRAVEEKHVRQAIETASVDFAQGAVGAGRGTRCYGLKGGIGSSSRIFSLDGRTFTVGALVQSNYGASRDLRLACLPEGLSACDLGSIILILATDLPVDARQMKRITKRASVAMARLGSYIGHGSGEIAIGFTTARAKKVSEHFLIKETVEEASLNLAFRAVGEACEEAIVQSMLHAKRDRTLGGETVHSLLEYMEKKDT